jgi:hypothetical protein
MAEPEHRRLAAIMFTDIVGYSALCGERQGAEKIAAVIAGPRIEIRVCTRRKPPSRLEPWRNPRRRVLSRTDRGFQPRCCGGAAFRTGPHNPR